MTVTVKATEVNAQYPYYEYCRKMLFWLDGTPNFYNQHFSYEDYSLNDPLCVTTAILDKPKLFMHLCNTPLRRTYALCEYHSTSVNDDIDPQKNGKDFRFFFLNTFVL